MVLRNFITSFFFLFEILSKCQVLMLNFWSKVDENGPKRSDKTIGLPSSPFWGSERTASESCCSAGRYLFRLLQSSPSVPQKKSKEGGSARVALHICRRSAENSAIGDPGGECRCSFSSGKTQGGSGQKRPLRRHRCGEAGLPPILRGPACTAPGNSGSAA